VDRSRGTTVSLVSAVAKERALDPVQYYGVYTKLGRLEMKPLTIGHLAREAGINLETVRYYERRGLLPKPPRSASGYRLFPAEAARRLKFIQRAQELGFSLREVQELLSLRVSPAKTAAEVHQRAESKISDIQSKIKSLQSTAKNYGIRSVPAVVIDGKLASCCAGRGPEEHVLRSALA